MKTILITGGTGSFGTAFIRELLRDEPDTQLVSVSRNAEQRYRLEAQFNTPRLVVVPGDVRQTNDLGAAFELGIDAVVHAAAEKHVGTGEKYRQYVESINIDGTANILEAALRHKVTTVLALSTDKACVDYFGAVEMHGGAKVPIHKLVKDRVQSTVLTMTRHGVGIARISGWFKNKRAERSMVLVTYLHGDARGCKGALVTEDHPVLTTSGWVKAGELEGRHRLITAEMAPNNRQMGAIIGLLLGDANIMRGGRGALRFGHSEAQAEWLEVTRESLSGLGRTSKTHVSTKLGRTPFYTWRMSDAAFIASLRDDFYRPDKIIPRDLVTEFFGPELLAAWFIDDGCRDVHLARIATHGFSKDDVEWVADFLTAKGLCCRALPLRFKSKTYYELRFTRAGSDRLFEIVGSYIPQCSRHKVPDWAPTYIPGRWKLGSAVPHLAAPITKRLEHRPTRRMPDALPQDNAKKTHCLRGHRLEGDNIRLTSAGGRQCVACMKQRPRCNDPWLSRDVYCLEVEGTHNFIVGGIVLHNCQPVNLYGRSKAAAEQYVLEANTDTLRASVVRYGNVAASSGSVLPLFFQQRAQGVLTVTDRRMSRYWMPLADDADVKLVQEPASQPVMSAVRWVRLALEHMRGGETFIPQIPSAMVLEMAQAVAPDAEIVETGIRPGEKLAEDLISYDEGFRTWRVPFGGWAILPKQWAHDIPAGWAQERSGFTYRSDQGMQPVRLEVANAM